jgi:hypothetical protein
MLEMRLKWTQDFCSLKNFIVNVVGLKGVWKSPGGNSKQFTSTNFDLNITWCPGKQNSILPHGKDGELLKKLLTSVLNNDCKRCDKTSEGFHTAIAQPAISSTGAKSPNTVPLESVIEEAFERLANNLIDAEGSTNVSNMPEEINASKGSLSDSDTAPSAASNSTIRDLEDFIDSSFFNVNGDVAPNFAQVSGTSTPFQQQDDDTSDSFELQFFSFKTKTESQILDLLSKMFEQNQVIDACEQDLCKFRSENLNLISRISFLEKKLSIVNHSEYDFNEQQSNN